MRKIISAVMSVVAILLVSSCNNPKALLPNVSGKAGEVVVVIDKEYWDGSLGNEVRSVLARDYGFLPQREPLYSIVNIAPGAFSDMFKFHRNIVILRIDPNSEKQGVQYVNDMWARPQCVIQVTSTCADSATVVFQKNAEVIAGFIEQSERNRVIANTKQYEEPGIADVVEGMIGGRVHFPMGYRIKKQTEDFLWIADEKQYTTQAVFIYKYPAVGDSLFSETNIIAKRNEVLKANVPGALDNTYMITSISNEAFQPEVKFIKYQGREFAQTRGLWEVYNDFMGGPFVSHSFYSKDGKDVIVLEAWVYAPKFDKRQYLRQVESFLYSFEWANDEEDKK